MNETPGLIVILGSPNDEAGALSEIGQGRIALGLQKFQQRSSQGWRILLTGGFGDHFNRTSLPHAEYGKRLLIELGVPEAAFVEPALSCNTVDDALKSRPIVEGHKVRNLLVVSSDFHMARVEFIFRAVFPDFRLEFAGAPYVHSRTMEERQRLQTHEERELSSLRERGASIVGGRLSVDSWRRPPDLDPSP